MEAQKDNLIGRVLIIRNNDEMLSLLVANIEYIVPEPSGDTGQVL